MYLLQAVLFYKKKLLQAVAPVSFYIYIQLYLLQAVAPVSIIYTLAENHTTVFITGCTNSSNAPRQKVNEKLDRETIKNIGSFAYYQQSP